MLNIKKCFYTFAMSISIGVMCLTTSYIYADTFNENGVISAKKIAPKMDEFGNLIRTTNLPSNAKRFPYIQQGVPNWCYEQQPWDDNYWGPYYTKSLIEEKASKVLKFPSQVYAGNSELASVMADNYKTLDAFIKAQMCVDYRTINRDTYINSIANAVSLNTTGTDLGGLKANAASYVDYVKKYKVIIDTEYKILPETAWVYNYAPVGVMNFSIYMKVKPVTITNGYFNTWGTSSLYNTGFKMSNVKPGQTYEGVVTYTLIQQKDGTWKLHAGSCSCWNQIAPSCDMLNGVAPKYKNQKRQDKFDYTWTKDEKKFYTRYQKDCVDPDL